MAQGVVTATHGKASASQSLQTLAGGAIVVAALYFARDVLIPLALALLLTFLLAPAVLRLRRWGLGRIPAVITTVVVAFTLIGLVGWVVTAQLLNLAHQLPNYQQNISQKLKSFETTGEGRRHFLDVALGADRPPSFYSADRLPGGGCASSSGCGVSKPTAAGFGPDFPNRSPISCSRDSIRQWSGCGAPRRQAPMLG